MNRLSKTQFSQALALMEIGACPGCGQRETLETESSQDEVITRCPCGWESRS